MTPLWLETHASYTALERTGSASQMTFNAGSLAQAALLKVPLIPAGVLTDVSSLTVEITVAHVVSIGQSKDSDIRYGVSDGTRFIGFETCDKGNYADHSPCYGMEGVSGVSTTSVRRDPVAPKTATLSTPVSMSSLSSCMNAGARATLRITQAT